MKLKEWNGRKREKNRVTSLATLTKYGVIVFFYF